MNVTRTETVVLAGGIKLRIDSSSMEPHECEIKLTFDADLVPVNLDLLQFQGKSPDTNYDVLMLATLLSDRVGYEE
jgi:hypothetical protein